MENRFLVSTDKSLLDIPFIHAFLKRSYWAEQIPIETVQRSIEHSLCFGVYEGKDQRGFARVVTDYATFAYLADVFIDEAYRGRGLSKLLMQHIMAHPQLQGLRSWFLVTRDAQGLYKQFGFSVPENPERLMRIVDTDIYKRAVQ